MTIKLSNNAVGRLSSPLSAVATSLSLSANEGARFPSLGVDEFFYVTAVTSAGVLEIMKCTARVGDVLTVVRGQEDTAPQAFSIGDRVELRLTVGALDDFVQPIRDTASSALSKANTALTATGTDIDPVGSLEAENVQEALEEIDEKTETALTAEGTSVDPIGELEAENVQEALEELDEAVGGKQPAGSYLVKGTGNSGSDGTVLTSSNLPAFSEAGSGGAAALQIHNNGNTSASAGIVFHRGGQYGCIFGLDNDNQLRVGGFSFGSVSYKIWHEGNLNPANYAPASGSGNYVQSNNRGVIMNWDYAGYRLDIGVDSVYLGQVWGSWNLNPATSGSTVQWNTGVVEFGSLVVGAPTWGADCPSPYVVVGIRGAGNAFVLRGVALRNQ